MSHDTTIDAVEAALDAAVGTVVHDLRAPVASIVAAARLLARPDVTADATKRLLAMVDRSEWTVADIIDDLIARSRPGFTATRARRSHVHIDGVLERVAEVVGSAREVTVEIDGVPGMSIWSHERTLTRLLLNLVDNAARHSGRPLVTISTVVTEDGVDLMATDEGPGLPEPVARWPTYRNPAGLAAIEDEIGLGLTTAVNLTDELGGSLSIDPQWVGTRISISLPQRGGSGAPSPGI